jgi:hypothetical protein
MKTAIEQLIEEMRSYSYKVSKEGNLDMIAAFEYAIGIAKKYKEKEKEQIIDAWIATDNKLQRLAAEEYYNQTYNQNKS